MLPLAASSAGAATSGTASTARAQAGAGSVAPGAPGSMSYFDLARKDCVGTAAGTASKVWYTVAGGVLSDTYEPTIDNTNVSTLQYVVTDGSTFTDLQTRDMTYTVSADPTGMACTVTATDAQHGYRLTTTYITDPGSDTVLMHTRLSAVPGSGTKVAGLHLYARLDAHVNGNGGGGSDNAGANSGVVTTSGGSAIPVVSSTNTVTNATNRTYAVPTYMALADSTPAPAGECRLRRHRQRRTHPAGHVPRADPVHVRAGRPHRGDPGAGAGPGWHADARARLRPHAGRRGEHGPGLARHPVRGARH